MSYNTENVELYELIQDFILGLFIHMHHVNFVTYECEKKFSGDFDRENYFRYKENKNYEII